MKGNVTNQGILLDFQWLSRIGIGGVQNFDASFDLGNLFQTPQLVDPPLTFLTPDWQRTLRNAVELAEEFGFEFTIASSAGWSESGGPWVLPEQAMKKLVWSETLIEDSAAPPIQTQKPPQKTGPFQDRPLASLGTLEVEGAESPVCSANVAIVAFRVPGSDLSQLVPTVSGNAGPVDPAVIELKYLAQKTLIPISGERNACIELSFSEPQRVQGLTSFIGHPLGMARPHDSGMSGWLEASDDGKTFQKIAEIPRNDALQQTLSFPLIIGRIFRVIINPPKSTFVEQLGLVSPPKNHEIAHLILHAGARVNRFEDKAGFSSRQIKIGYDTPEIDAGDAIPISGVIELTDRLNLDGSLNWTPPPGRWLVLRFGYSLTGRTNYPASRAGTGLEVDKLNAQHVKAYIETYLDNYQTALGADLVGRKGLRYVLTDSFEAGPQNWTNDMLEQFERRRGYSATPWLPVLSGRVLESAISSDRFLWDFRKTISELMAEAHYGQITASLQKRGLGRYGESHETQRAFIGDGMEVKKTAEIPMGAIWAARTPGYTIEEHDADIRESASVAHIYGRDFVAAESFTSYGNTYGFTPEMLKPLADRAMAMGLNRFVIHTSVHQPDSKVGPGIGLGPFGQWFTRKEVWAEMAGAWVTYLARSSFLLQQGQFIADIAYQYGEDTNLTSLFGMRGPPIPLGYNFDFVNPDALINELSVKNGDVVTRSGMRYRLLALDEESTRRVSVPVLRKIRELVNDGATIVGTRPLQTPSLADSDEEFGAIVTELWGPSPGKRSIGAGNVFSSLSLEEALHSLQISPDVEFLEQSDPELRFVHRTLGNEGELYFISNGTGCAREVQISFRVAGRKPELWRADTGAISRVSYRMESGRTIVPLSLDANDAVFVLFRELTTEQGFTLPAPEIKQQIVITGPWDLSFPPDHGAPSSARFENLRSWTNHSEDGIKFFSGVATYSKALHLPADWLDDRSKLLIDLGEVKYLAEVHVNGQLIGALWKPPFRIDITSAAQAGENHLEIKIANLWPNRLIGDKQPGARQIAFATYDPFKADSPLLPSGLLGPVRLMRNR